VQTPAGDSMSVAFIHADFGLAFFESTDICPRQSLCTPACKLIQITQSANSLYIIGRGSLRDGKTFLEFSAGGDH